MNTRNRLNDFSPTDMREICALAIAESDAELADSIRLIPDANLFAAEEIYLAGTATSVGFSKGREAAKSYRA